MASADADLSPPPTPGPTSFAPRPLYPPKALRSPARSLSLRIPEDGQAFGELTQTSLPLALPHAPASRATAPPLTLQLPDCQAGPSTPAPPSQARTARKRPSRLNLAPPSLNDESGSSSRSMPNSPVTLSRSNSKVEHLDDAAPPISAISEAVKHLSSTLRGTPRRRPSMPFKNTSLPDSAYPEPPCAASSRSRPPEAFRDPSEHILSGKGSTLQHARSVYSHGPVEILPGLFLGDEHNARDDRMLSALGITTILNVAKETVLDFQSESHPPSSHTSASHSAWTNPPNNICKSDHNSGSAMLTSCSKYGADFMSRANNGQAPQTPSTYFTPPTTASLPTGTGHGEASSPRDAISPSVLRNTSSTPNLLTQFMTDESSSMSEADSVRAATSDSTSTSDLRTLTAQDVLQYRSLRRNSGSSSDDAFDTASSPSSSRAASTCTSAATELTPPALMSLRSKADADAHGGNGPGDYTSQQPSPSYAFDDGSQHSPSSWITNVELPSNATAIKIPFGMGTGRMRELRYIKLPWTHDETDLASGHGGFARGCALIAETLGIDARFWYAAKIAEDRVGCAALENDASLEHVQTSPTPGKILVHCQCGVSRSATLVIAFVMQAAAMRYGFEAARTLLGMHDCYNMVKEKSSSISPNISLIYQLVEWERYLSSAAGRLRDVLGMGCNGSGDEAGASVDTNANASLAAGWSTETMDEAMWSKMRLEEEEKEAAEEETRREERFSEAKRLAAERKAAQDRLEGRVPDVAIAGDATAGSSLMQRRRKKAPILQLQTATSPAASGSALAFAPIPSPGLKRRRPPALQLSDSTRAGAGDKARLEVETPFQTARTDTWADSGCDGHGDVMMNDLEPPQTPLCSSAADSDVVSTPTARTSMALGPGSGSALCTPCAWNSSIAASGQPAQERCSPSYTSRLPPPSDMAPAKRASTDGVVHNTLLSPSSPGLSPAMSTSLSLGSPSNRFSLGGSGLSGTLTARLETDFEPRSRARPDSMQSTMSSFSSSTALFGVTALSREERKKQHRRTFSSDWPTLQGNLANQRRRSKVDSILPSLPLAPGVDGTWATATQSYTHDLMDF
ncbi:uncharacterized protein MEPE_04001 [Melanopsichium pennsylvanicum]|uniref:protein-tyrosine-phosphatase n=2 Tax=Melanopsichium pennsylvanicum TaxID=63383 RepID=A0AAJ5C5Z9_9BASI|nr:tyrosine-protein phosphatase [Melanopsichium pennsylvanicum 4]SNX85292.1 uncharacterized protein MEPE_04001 [Melanopsichium pennsylvanicum]